MGEFAYYPRLAETVFVIPTDKATFLSWLRARAAKDAGIGVIPNLKHYHYSHLDSEPIEGVPGSYEFGLRRDIMDGGNWQRIPIVSINIISLSSRQESAQCEVWVARLHKTGLINGQPSEFTLWEIANYEYDRLTKDIAARWTKTVVSSEDHRAYEWQAYDGKLPGDPPQQESPYPAPHSSSHSNDQTSKTVILFLASDPADAVQLRLDEEFREIYQTLRAAQQRDRVKLVPPQLALRPSDISQALLDEQPSIVHFSGHGTSTGAICFENQGGRTHLVPADALAGLFKQFAEQVECVVLNACYSEIQAKGIAAHIRYVIGMNQEIGDQAAIAFSVGFYQALGAGRAIEEAYKLGCVQIRLHDIPEHLTPVLIKKGQTQP